MCGRRTHADGIVISHTLSRVSTTKALHRKITKSQIPHHMPKGLMGQLNQNMTLQVTKDNLLTSDILELVRVIDPLASGQS